MENRASEICRRAAPSLMERIRSGIGHARGDRPGIRGKRADVGSAYAVLGDGMSSGRPVIVASSHNLAGQCDGGDQRGRCESHLDHFVSPNGERTQMFVSLLESGEPCETFHHATSRKREHLRSHVVKPRVICPTGKSLGFVKSDLSSPFRKNNSLYQKCKSAVCCASSSPTQGAYRDRHGRWVEDAMDVLAQLTNAHHTDGEGVWF